MNFFMLSITSLHFTSIFHCVAFIVFFIANYSTFTRISNAQAFPGRSEIRQSGITIELW